MARRASASTLAWLLVVASVIAGAVLLGVGAVELAGLPHRPALPASARVAGGAVAVAGAALAVWTFVHHPPRTMAFATGRTIEIASRRLSPEESAVPALVTTGPYRLVRNPTYLATFLLVEGLGLALPLLGLLVAGLVLLSWWNLVVIPAEERELAARFGDDYARYRAATGRFVPRMR